MNFLACEGAWTLRPDGTAACAGALHSLTSEEMRSEVGSALTWDQVAELQGEVITLFALAFGFLVLKRLLK
ncbi:hypothetical protein [Pseudomonas citronellolis]|uniref:hypothetical protein n=1 Tax=Pseudomonas citronellolis TaxID=53408 RepID=UPI00209D7B55|nr:hypothetical protein [Pseudomonas citronellolis]MCP1602680.1 hypothetical protein [Pseudomonas citronellolis]MCP1653738.1 hypothetical protein [Pseudomonas citronellolis]MCP1720683.1 hypothetical protein [Pseudomonas citronellolis]